MAWTTDTRNMAMTTPKAPTTDESREGSWCEGLRNEHRCPRGAGWSELENHSLCEQRDQTDLCRACNSGNGMPRDGGW